MKIPFVFDNVITHSVPYGSIFAAIDYATTPGPLNWSGAVANSILKKAAALSPAVLPVTLGINIPTATQRWTIRQLQVYSSDTSLDTLFGLWDVTDTQAVYVYRIAAGLASQVSTNNGLGGTRVDFTTFPTDLYTHDGLVLPPGWVPFVFSESTTTDAVALVSGFLDLVQTP